MASGVSNLWEIQRLWGICTSFLHRTILTCPILRDKSLQRLPEGSNGGQHQDLGQLGWNLDDSKLSPRLTSDPKITVSVSSWLCLGLISFSSRSRPDLVAVSSRSRLGLVLVSSRSRTLPVDRYRWGLWKVWKMCQWLYRHEPLGCLHCDFEFSTSSAIIEEAWNMAWTGQKPVSCSHCDFQFSTSSVLIEEAWQNPHGWWTIQLLTLWLQVFNIKCFDWRSKKKPTLWMNNSADFEFSTPSALIKGAWNIPHLAWTLWLHCYFKCSYWRSMKYPTLDMNPSAAPIVTLSALIEGAWNIPH